MPLKDGHDQESVSYNVKELVRSGRDPKEAVAIALSHARKSKKMAAGGMVEDEAPRDLYEENVDSQPSDISNPENMSEHNKDMNDMKKDADSKGYAMGGLVQPETSDEIMGNKPSEDMMSSTEEPLSSLPMKPAALDHALLSQDAMNALAERKKKRRYGQP